MRLRPRVRGGKAAERAALKKALLEVLDRPTLKQARVSFELDSLDDGSVVFAQNPDELLNPASNVKLFTAAAALARLGPEYRFETEFLTDAESARQGRQVKTLYVRGKGDPTHHHRAPLRHRSPTCCTSGSKR